MKQYTHAWLAMMAIKRLEKGPIPETEGTGSKCKEINRYARTLVRWFKNYRDFVVQGAWYPDAVFKDMGTSHGLKHTLFLAGEKPRYLKLPDTMEVRRLMMSESKIYKEKTPFIVDEKTNLNDRCEALCHTVVDNFKIQYREEKGNSIAPSSTHMAMRMFILSHYIADGHMPLHCDARSLGVIHAAIEAQWENQVKKCYRIDKDNERFFYDPDGYPLANEKMSDLMKTVEENIITRPFVYAWGSGISSAREYMEAVTQYSFLLAQEMVPTDVGNVNWTDYQETEAVKDFDKYSAMILTDAIDSIARAWLHVWIRYREWGPDKSRKDTGDIYAK